MDTDRDQLEVITAHLQVVKRADPWAFYRATRRQEAVRRAWAVRVSAHREWQAIRP